MIQYVSRACTKVPNYSAQIIYLILLTDCVILYCLCTAKSILASWWHDFDYMFCRDAAVKQRNSNIM